MRSFDVINRYNYTDRYNPITYVNNLSKIYIYLKTNLIVIGFYFTPITFKTLIIIGLI
jgi:hypothetical protein